MKRRRTSISKPLYRDQLPLPTLNAELANGLGTKKFNGKFASRLARKVAERRNVSNRLPSWPCVSGVMNVLLAKFAEAADPNSAEKIGSAVCPARPRLANVEVPPHATRLAEQMLKDRKSVV